jgi:hypothetical protein
MLAIMLPMMFRARDLEPNDGSRAQGFALDQPAQGEVERLFGLVIVLCEQLSKKIPHSAETARDDLLRLLHSFIPFARDPSQRSLQTRSTERGTHCFHLCPLIMREPRSSRLVQCSISPAT